MKQSSFSVFAFGLALISRAADATSPVDYTQRNESFAPGTSVTSPKTDTPQTNERIQQKRVDQPTIEKQTAPLAGRRAPITVEEMRAKNVREKDSRRPEAKEQSTSAFNHKPAAINPGTSTTKPPTVTRYQQSMATATPWGPAAAAGNTPRFSTTDAATTAKINRFVFRKNPTEGSVSSGAAVVTPAGGGAAIKK